MTKVFPDRPIEDIPDNDPIFHTIYDLQDRFQVPGAQFLIPASRMRQGATGMSLTGAASATRRAASWSRSATTWI